MRIKVRALEALMCGALLLASGGGVFAAEAEAGAEGATQTNWKAGHADVDVANKAALQRGARNFMNYCLGCHSLKYERYSRMGQRIRATHPQEPPPLPGRRTNPGLPLPRGAEPR